MNIFLIDYHKLSVLLLPTDLRKLKIKALLKVYLSPVIRNYNEFLTFRDNSIYKLEHNSQIASLEDVLNDSFDNSLRRIRIANVEFKEPVYFYEPEDNKEVYHYEPEDNKPVYYYEAEDFAGDGVDFVVMVPPDLRPAQPTEENAFIIKMEGLINYYKLYSKNYKIVWVLANI